MRTKSKWVINLVYTILTVCWYINMGLAVIGFAALVLTFSTKEYTTMSIPAKVKGVSTTTDLQPLSSTTWSATADYNQAIIKMRLKVTPAIIGEAFGFFMAIEAIIILVLYHLRKIFAAIKSHEPFQYVIVYRLRVVALCLFSTTSLKAVWGWADYMTLTTNVKDFSRHFMLVWSDNFIGIIIGVLLYVIAEVFRYGIELKNENEAFV